MSAMMDCLGPDWLALPLVEPLLAGIDGVFEGVTVASSGLVSCHFFPTHSPNPSLAPPGERGGLHLAASLKVGNLRATWRWPRSGGNPATSRCSQVWSRIGWPALDFPANHPQGGFADQTLRQRQVASSGLQPSERRLNQLPILFDGNAPLRAFFPPSKTRPNVAVSSLSAPAGVERVGVRGGIQRIRNKNAADSRRGNPSDAFSCIQKELQKQEQTMHITHGLEAKNLQKMAENVQFAKASRELTR
ncbi:MAG: hypothetical protein KJ614_02135 [Gammaproteobacteria bacterium]|nr:hypothetical protein [Gammaproteobacteria bacterium]MBU3998783.1 hypothetical protein [Gammaproteobacteria bacterium]MBU4081565.1 hypothetical protein [Gammaproteobacteria bacterium]MBU4114082.1 hypothetical protein [Gammaproteobacteria bacterium]MBU4170009.1 hypothetical protein [Gammaproteobacteria bacterium]